MKKVKTICLLLILGIIFVIPKGVEAKTYDISTIEGIVGSVGGTFTVNEGDIFDLEFTSASEYSVDNFKTNVEDTIYKSMENNSDGKRRQDLPEVSSIDNTSVETSTFTIGEEEHESFVVNINWSYVSDLGYDDNATITLIELNEKLYVVEYVTGE